MRVGDAQRARELRDGGIEAMDVLNDLLRALAPYSSEDEEREVRRAVARSMSAILDNIVNPALADFPELEVDEDTWGQIARARAQARLASLTASAGEGSAPEE